MTDQELALQEALKKVLHECVQCGISGCRKADVVEIAVEALYPSQDTVEGETTRTRRRIEEYCKENPPLRYPSRGFLDAVSDRLEKYYAYCANLRMRIRR